MKKLLFITNGHGEDLAAAEIIKKLPVKINISVLPIVGKGEIFKNLDVQVLGPKKKLPSGGFSLRNLWFLIKDLSAGLLKNTLGQIKLLFKLKKKFDLVVGIGDIVPIIGSMFIKAPFIFVGVNKSCYYQTFGYSYTPWEKLLLQSRALKVFVRDRKTEEGLKKRGIKIACAEYAGNLLMDCMGQMINDPPKAEKMTNEGHIIIGFLPGTRDDTNLNIEDFEKLAEEIIKTKEPRVKIKFIIATTLKDLPSCMENKPFNQVLKESNLIIGLSGTGNEQAAGLGKPVVSFYGRGSQYNKKFAKAQKELLGQALCLIQAHDLTAVARNAWSLLRNPEKIKRMSKIGQERMGEQGAAKKIAEYIQNSL